MKRKFIHIVILLFTIISCRELEENAVYDQSAIEIKRENQSITSKSSSENEQASDGIAPNNPELAEEDPPVKHGGHWRVQHNNYYKRGKLAEQIPYKYDSKH
ncbi:hypothetical protein ACI513_03715 [Chryseobacterium sp. M5]|uniref:hypothetical protein n=1 Tax=Chryseobacterium sp. M5 TaxID=3379128 RepID=UPI003857B450